MFLRSTAKNAFFVKEASLHRIGICRAANRMNVGLSGNRVITPKPVEVKNGELVWPHRGFLPHTPWNDKALQVVFSNLFLSFVKLMLVHLVYL